MSQSCLEVVSKLSDATQVMHWSPGSRRGRKRESGFSRLRWPTNHQWPVVENCIRRNYIFCAFLRGEGGAWICEFTFCFESRFKTFQKIDWALVFDQRDLVSKQIVRMRREKSEPISFNNNSNRVLYKKSVNRYMWYLQSAWQNKTLASDMVQLWHNVRKDLWPGPHRARGSKEFQALSQSSSTSTNHCVFFLIVHVGQFVYWSGLVDVELWKGWPQSWLSNYFTPPSKEC